MSLQIESDYGYIVFEDGGISPIEYGACETWFKTYDEAIDYALEAVKKRTEELKRYNDRNSVIVYKGAKELLDKTHSSADGEIIFSWQNYDIGEW